MIETICPNCGNKKSFDDSYAGRTFRCPNCKEPVTIQSVADMVKTETDSHEISFEEQIKKAEEEKKRKEEWRLYYKRKKELNSTCSGAKISIWLLAIFVVIPVVFIVLVQKKRKQLLQEIEDLESEYHKKTGKI